MGAPVGAAEDLGTEQMLGVSLDQYAGICAATAEGFELDTILGQEGLAREPWRRAERAWKVRIAKAGAESELASAFQSRRGVAEDCLAREVTPIDTELASWLSFLRAWRESTSPFELLERASLGLNDLARLQRAWASRFEADEKLRDEAAKLAPTVSAKLPAIRVASRSLKRFPWSPRGVHAETGAAPPVSPARAAPSSPLETSMAPGQLRLYAYVAIKARLAESPGDEKALLEQLNIRDFATTDTEWQARLGEDPVLARDYRRLVDAQRSKIRARGASPALRHGAASPVPKPSPAVSAPVPQPSRLPVLAGTSLVLDVPAKAALPFALSQEAKNAENAPIPSVAASSPARLGGTSLALDPPRGAPLPFSRADQSARPPAKLAGTSLAVDVPVKAALPFPAKPPPRLTLEQHASLTCEITEAPHHAPRILSRYGLSASEKVAADHEMTARFGREPAARAAWESAYQTYRAYLVTSGLIPR